MRLFIRISVPPPIVALLCVVAMTIAATGYA